MSDGINSKVDTINIDFDWWILQSLFDSSEATDIKNPSFRFSDCSYLIDFLQRAAHTVPASSTSLRISTL